MPKETKDELLTRIEQLEVENRRLRERENDSTQTLHTLIRKFPSASVAVGSEMEIVQANEQFIRMAGYRGAQAAESIPTLEGVPLDYMLPDEICAAIESAHYMGEQIEHKDIIIENVPHTLSIYSIRRGELTIVLFRDLSNPDVRAEELAARLQQTADRNIRMTQQIALLLGEEVSENTKAIGSVIRALRMTSKNEVSR